MSKNLRGLSGRTGPVNGLYEEIVRAVTEDHEKKDEKLAFLSGGFMTGTSAVLGVSSFYDFLHAGHITGSPFSSSKVVPGTR